MVKCPFCGKEVSDEACKCEHCGKAVYELVRERRVRFKEHVNKMHYMHIFLALAFLAAVLVFLLDLKANFIDKNQLELEFRVNPVCSKHCQGYKSSAAMFEQCIKRCSEVLE